MLKSETVTSSPIQETPVLVLSRKRNESVLIGDRIEVVVIEIRGDKVRLGIGDHDGPDALGCPVPIPQSPESDSAHAIPPDAIARSLASTTNR